MKADLHMHSIYSDGLDTPAELVKKAHTLGLTDIALTDHDSFEGVAEFMSEAEKYNINSYVGIELSTYTNNESVHLLGYFFNDISDDLIDFTLKQLTDRKNRAKNYANNLINLYNVKINIDELLNNKGMITRAHLAAELRRSNPELSEELIKEYLSSDSKAFIKASEISTVEGIKLLKDSNAIIILAHPTLLKKNNVEDIIKLGVDGIEAYYPLNEKGQEEVFVKLAKKYNLIISAGSDYHGKIDHTHKDMGTVYVKENLFKRCNDDN